MSTLGTPRRYYLAKRHAAIAKCDWGTESVWQAKQEAEPGVTLPDDFKLRARLEAKGYTTYEDLDGADVTELREQDFTKREAEAILAAAAQ